MKKSSYALFLIIIIIILVAVGIYAARLYHDHLLPAQPSGVATTTTASASNSVAYYCEEGKTINATYAQAGVTLALSDGRNLTLPQVESGSGIKYEQGDLDFWSEGNNAFITEASSTTYTNCVGGVESATGAGTTSFTDSPKSFTFNFPNDFSVSGGDIGYSQSWSQEATTSGMTLVVLNLPSSYEPKTNFAGAKFTVGDSSDPSALAGCLTEPSGPMATSTHVTINGTPFTKITFSDAGAGNYYDTTSYRTIKDGLCYAVEYTIHSSNIQNYPSDSGISAFDETKVQNALESIVQSFKFL